MKDKATRLRELVAEFSRDRHYAARWDALRIVRDICKLTGNYPGVDTIDRVMQLIDSEGYDA
jgi:hypothetical protein